MKAILVIDVPNDFETETAIAIVDVKNEKGEGVTAMCPIKPMPEPIYVEVNEIEDLMHVEYSIEDIYTNKYVATIRLATDKLISLGWNACLMEIEK